MPAAASRPARSRSPARPRSPPPPPAPRPTATGSARTPCSTSTRRPRSSERCSAPPTTRVCGSIRLDFTMGAVFGFLKRSGLHGRRPGQRARPPLRPAGRRRADRAAVLAGRLSARHPVRGRCPSARRVPTPRRSGRGWSWRSSRRSPAVDAWELGNEPDVARRSLLHRHACRRTRAWRRSPRAPSAPPGPRPRSCSAAPRAWTARSCAPCSHDDAQPARRSDRRRRRAPPRQPLADARRRARLRSLLPPHGRRADRSGSPRPATRRIPRHQWDRTLAGGERDQARWIAARPARARRRWRGPRVRHAPRRPRVRPSERLRLRGRRPLAAARRRPGASIPKPAFAALRRLAVTPIG